MRDQFPPAAARPLPPRPDSPGERALVDRFPRAYQGGDVAGLVALLTEDIAVTMPPLPLEYHGRDAAAAFFARPALTLGRSPRLTPPRSNGQPTFGVYVLDPQTGIWHTSGVLVLTLTGDKI